VDFMRGRGYDPAWWDTQAFDLQDPSTMEVTQIRRGLELGGEGRERQPDVVDFVLDSTIKDDHHSRLITLPTGYGKGIISLWALAKRGWRTCYILVPQYIEKTYNEIKEKTTAGKKDVMVASGGDSIRGLIELGKKGEFDSDFLLISMKTWTNYIDSYLKDPQYCVEQEYGCAPEELFNLLGIGTLVIDEIHQQFHAVYKTLCFTHVDLVIGMSATFDSPDQFVNKMQFVMFPKEMRFNEVAMEKYIKAFGICYSIRPESLAKIKTSERGQTSYSQNQYEVSIYKHTGILKEYLKLLHENVENGFMDAYQRGYKCVIFVRRIEMATLFVQELRKWYPHIDIQRYVAEDPYENLIDPVIRVTTQGSGGTGHDIGGLMSTIALDNINDIVANRQRLGRLRKPKEGFPRFFSVYSESIQKHVMYHRNRREAFADRVLFFKEIKSNICL
jgi:hypothetical protein